MNKKWWLMSFGSVMIQLGVLGFLISYFPIKKTTSDTSIHEVDSCFHLDLNCNEEACRSLNSSCFVPPKFDRLVFIVIDAMRSDFLLPDIRKESDNPQLLFSSTVNFDFLKKKNLKFFNKLLESKEALAFRSRVRPPTVTLSGVKAMMTGTVSAFVDVIWNFGSGALTDDSLLLQLKKMGKRSVFYGDETWLKLFPDSFQEADGVTSFFVSDYVQVDSNVTRHLEKTLQRNDWHCLFLHYLGLDHIGHLSGASSDLVGPKLKEMDDAICQIKTGLDEMDKSDRKRSLLVVTSDHGMTMEGSHGGSSPDEVMTPLVFIGSAFKDVERSLSTEIPEVHQVDLVPTISFLLGVPIPANNMGSAVWDAFGFLGVRDLLKLFHINGRQLIRVLERNVLNHEENVHYKSFTKAEELHRKLMTKAGTQSTSTSSSPSSSSSSSSSSLSLGENGNEILSLYREALAGLSDELVFNLSKYDVYGMAFSIVVVATCSFTLLMQLVSMVTVRKLSESEHRTKQKPGIVTMATPFLLASFHACACIVDSSASDCLCGSPWRVAAGVVVLFLVGFVFAVEASELYGRRWRSRTEVGDGNGDEDSTSWMTCSIWKNPLSCFILIGFLIHLVSLASSSYVEEEQNTYHFLVVSFHVLLLFLYVRDLSRRLTVLNNRVKSDKSESRTGSTTTFEPRTGSTTTFEPLTGSITTFEPRTGSITSTSTFEARTGSITSTSTFEARNKSQSSSRLVNCKLSTTSEVFPRSSFSDSVYFRYPDRLSPEDFDESEFDESAVCDRDAMSVLRGETYIIGKNVETVLFLIGSLVVCRVSRSWNRTGDKWKHLEDVGDWLNRPEQRVLLSLTFFVSVAGVFIIEFCRFRKSLAVVSCAVIGCLSSCVYHATIGGVDVPFLRADVVGAHLSTSAAQASFFIAVLAFTMTGRLLSASDGRSQRGNVVDGDGASKRSSGMHDFASASRLSLTLVTLTLVRPHNLFLVFSNHVSVFLLHVAFSRGFPGVFVNKLFLGSTHQRPTRSKSRSLPDKFVGPAAMAVLYLWMGLATFFYQGNSNSITTIDVAVGNRGQTEYSFVSAGLLTFLHTYSSFLFWMISLVVELSDCDGGDNDVDRESEVIQGSRSLTTTAAGEKDFMGGKLGLSESKMEENKFSPARVIKLPVGFQNGRDTFDISGRPNKSKMHVYSNYDVETVRHSERTVSKSSYRANVAGSVLMSLHSILLTWYLCLMMLLRYHLFVWSVFAPKLLYVSFLQLLITVFVLFWNVFI